MNDPICNCDAAKDDTSVSFRLKLEKAINQCSMENGSDTPDFILAEYLMDCLLAFDYAMQRRKDWYGKGK
jgi:hypothetical protein